MIFLASVTALAFLVFASSLGHLIFSGQEEDKGFLKTIADAPLSFVLVVYAALVAVPVSCLSGYHIYIVSHGETTIEQIKKVWQDSQRERTGCLHNWKRVLFGDIPPSRLYAVPYAGDHDAEMDGEAMELLEVSRRQGNASTQALSIRLDDIDLETGAGVAPVVDPYCHDDSVEASARKPRSVGPSVDQTDAVNVGGSPPLDNDTSINTVPTHS